MQAIHLTADDFDTKTANTRALIAFWAEWCGPCKALAPTIDSLAAESEGKYLVGRINVDEQGDLAHRFEINSIPTVIILDNGIEKKRFIGGQPKSTYLAEL